MREATIVRSDGRVICGRCLVADTFLPRLRGLLGRRSLDSDEGMIFRPASSIHTFFMRFPIDVVFLDRDGVVVRICPAVRPWRVVGKARARAALELPAGECRRRGLEMGDRLVESS